MSTERGAGRGTRVAGAVAGAVATAVVVAAVIAVGAGTPRAADEPPHGPTVAGATDVATPTSPGASSPAQAAAQETAPGDAAGGTATGATVPRELRDVVDVVAELESGGPLAAPVGPGDEVEAMAGVRLTVEAVRAVDGQAAGPGESSGPALAIDVRITNDTDAAVSADGLVVNVYGADAVPGSQLLGDPRSAPLQGDIAGGTSAQGVYVITGPGGSTTGPHVVSLALGAGSTTALVVLT